MSSCSNRDPEPGVLDHLSDRGTVLAIRIGEGCDLGAELLFKNKFAFGYLAPGVFGFRP